MWIGPKLLRTAGIFRAEPFLGIPAKRHVLLALVWIKTLKNPGTLYSNT